MDITSIRLFEIRIDEPVTALTDLLVSAVCFYAFQRVNSKNGYTHVVHVLFRYFFLTMGLATAWGGIAGHAFNYTLGFGWKVPGWIISMFSITLIERAAIIHAKPLLKPRLGNFFAALNIVELITFLVIVLFTLNFFFVEMHATYGLMIVVTLFELLILLKTNDTGSKYILWAIGISALSAVIHLAKIAPHPWFNHLDLSHVLLAISAWLFYKGVQNLKFYSNNK